MQPMPLSSKEKQEAFRARHAMLGMTEVRGIFLPPELHAELKRLAKELHHSRSSATDSAKTGNRGGV